MSTVKCSFCDGTGQIVTIKAVIGCNRCNGSGCVQSHMDDWATAGLSFRSWREDTGHGLRSFAIAIGMQPSELSALEQGLKENSCLAEIRSRNSTSQLN